MLTKNKPELKTQANKKIKISTQQLTIVALMTAFAMLIPSVMPRLPLPEPFSVTFASHVPVIISMFISPIAAVCTVIGGVIGFFIKGATLIVIARAASHIFFALVGAYLIRKKFNLVLTLVITALVHAIGETYVAIPVMGLILSNNQAFFNFAQFMTFYGTLAHHIADFIISVIILIPLSKAKFIPYQFTKDRFTKLKGV